MPTAKSQNLVWAPFCAELQAVLDAELAHELGATVGRMPVAVIHSVCNDVRFGWHDQCLCTLHRHMLVAGTTKPASQS